MRRRDGEIHSASRCGSRVYGTAGPGSDEDFVVVLADASARQDLLFVGGVNVVVHGTGSFAKALADQSVFACEALFAPPPHRLKEGRPPLPFRLDRDKLAASARARSDADFKKAAKTFADEPRAAKKKLFHALRVPIFARQLVQHRTLVDFTEAAPLWVEIAARADLTWEPYAQAYGALRERICDWLGRRQ
jgi:hypothetical protein